MRRTENEITDTAEILNILKEAEICRIALHDDPFPYIVPLNYGVEEAEALTFYFHCAMEGKKLDLIRKNSKVCFEVDVDAKIVSGEKACKWTMQYKSVIGFGSIEIVEAAAEKLHGLKVLMNHYSPGSQHEFAEGPYSRTVVLKLNVESFTGKKHGLG